MEIVVNEWLLVYMRLGVDQEKTSKVIQFLLGLKKKCDRIVVKRQSPFFMKFYRYFQESNQDTKCKELFKTLNLLFYNSDKTIIVDDVDIDKLPKEIDEILPADDKDRYLIELGYSSSDKIILTTDQRLKDKLQPKSELKIYLFEEFLASYLS